ncbi:MAG: alpha/beta hydrolase, partial [Pseudomonadota bacterium]|nr:alpha/beta hydrolase [Pseudomonadota bacterium]
LSFQDEHIWLKMAKNTFRCSEDGELRFDWDVKIVKPMLKSNYKIPDMWPLFKALADVPTMVLRGAESDILSPTCFAEMQKLKPDLCAVEIPRAGHVPTLAEPESIGALDSFLARH